MRAELNYNSPVKYDVEIIFPNVGGLYYDICDYVDFVWYNLDVIAYYDYDGTNHFNFSV
jgi:hypothetical protein